MASKILCSFEKQLKLMGFSGDVTVTAVENAVRPKLKGILKGRGAEG